MTRAEEYARRHGIPVFCGRFAYKELAQRWGLPNLVPLVDVPPYTWRDVFERLDPDVNVTVFVNDDNDGRPVQREIPVSPPLKKAAGYFLVPERQPAADGYL